MASCKASSRSGHGRIDVRESCQELIRESAGTLDLIGIADTGGDETSQAGASKDSVAREGIQVHTRRLPGGVAGDFHQSCLLSGKAESIVNGRSGTATDSPALKGLESESIRAG